MGKTVSNSVLDASHEKTATAVRQTLCSDEPADYEDIASVALASAVLTPGDGNGDWTIADGDVSGRKITVAQQSDVAISDDGEATHIAYDDGEELLRVTTCTPQVLTQGGTVTVPAHKFEIADPS